MTSTKENSFDALNLTLDDIISAPVTILDGIAGAAKTSRTVALLQQNEIPYLHLTSTNKLKRDIISRFGTDAKTIASGLFQNTETFYDNERDQSTRTIVLDEILQTSSKVYGWIEHHKRDHNIIICTDSHQTLSPHTGGSLLTGLYNLSEQPGVNTFCLTTTHRPVNEITERLFYDMYVADPDGRDGWDYIKCFANIISMSPETLIPYDPHNVYICHSNDIERVIYREWELSKRYDLDLIPKGTIANRKVKDITKYPILAQSDIPEGYAAYWQVSNIGSVLRYQGSEVDPERTLYYFIAPDSVPDNRELYTMVTRLKDISSLVIVLFDMNSERDIELTSFMGLPIIPQADYIDDESDIKDDKELYKTLLSLNKSQNAKYYVDIIKRGRSLTKDLSAPRPAIPKGKYTAWGIARKMPYIKLARPNTFLHQIELTGYKGGISTPCNTDCPITEPLPDDEVYGVDLYSAYIYAWKHSGLPDGRTYRTDDKGEVKLYITTSDSSASPTKPGTIITEILHNDFVQNYPKGAYSDVFIGSIDRLHGKDDKFIDQLVERTVRSVEAKADVKKIQWGWFQKKYLEPVNFVDGLHPKAYIRHTQNTTFLTMVFIQSELCHVMNLIKKALCGTMMSGKTLVDCCYISLNHIDKTISDDDEAIGRRVEEAIPGYYFRMAHVTSYGRFSDNEILYQNYKPLLTEKEYKKEMRRKHEKSLS